MLGVLVRSRRSVVLVVVVRVRVRVLLVAVMCLFGVVLVRSQMVRSPSVCSMRSPLCMFVLSR